MQAFNASETPQDQNSPYAVAQNLLHRYLDEEISGQDFIQAIGRFSEHVQTWRDHLSSLVLPQSEDAEESAVLLDGALQGVDLIAEGVDTMGAILETPTAELAEEALQKILDGQNLLKQVQGITDINVTSAIDGARYMD